jgi:hypothetical protein
VVQLLGWLCAAMGAAARACVARLVPSARVRQVPQLQAVTSIQKNCPLDSTTHATNSPAHAPVSRQPWLSPETPDGMRSLRTGPPA